MKAWLGVFVVGMAVLPQPAAAQSRGFGPWLQGPGQGAQSREPAQREMRRERRAPPEREERRNDRLTDQERRELRRDIDQADREIYRQNRRR